MQQEIPSYEAILETLRWAAQGYMIGPGEAVRPMPWRRILYHLSVLGRGELLCIAPSANGTGSGVAVRRIPANGRPGAANGPHETTWAMDARDGSRLVAQFAQRIEMAVRSGEYRSATCMRRGSMIFAVMTGASASFARSNGDRPLSPRVRAGTSPKDVYRMTPSQRRTRRKGYAAYTIMAASLLLSLTALLSTATRDNDTPPPPMPANAIVGQVLIGGRGADGVTVVLDGRIATITTRGGAFRFDDVEAGTHTISLSNYPADARFDRTSATASIDIEGRATPVNFSGSYIRGSRSTRPVLMADGGGTGRPAFQFFRVSDSHLLGVVTDDMDLQRVATIPLPRSLRRPTRGMRRPAGGATAREGRRGLGSACGWSRSPTLTTDSRQLIGGIP